MPGKLAKKRQGCCVVMDAILNPFTASTFGLVGGAVVIVLFILVRARRKREEAAMDDWDDDDA